MGGFEIIEHTADVGVEAWDETPEGCLEQATLGLLDITGTWQPGPGEPHAIQVEGRDLGSVLVEWLSEVLYLQDARDAVVTAVDVDSVTETTAGGTVDLRSRTAEPAGTAVKAVTYHQLTFERGDDRWRARFIVDV